MIMRHAAVLAGLTLVLCISDAVAQVRVRNVPTTYCNPMNLDYAFIPPEHRNVGPPHRSTADPALVNYRDTMYLFSTNQYGYWWSFDMSRWHFVENSFRPNRNGDNVCAPGALAFGDTMLFIPSIGPGDSMAIYRSTDPAHAQWETAIDPFPIASWDPGFLRDDDGRIYLYWGSSNLYPIRGVELDRNTFRPVATPIDILYLKPEEHGWERFGEGNSDTTHPYIEGAWMTKHGGKYYLQYAAPGTEWNVYADGVYVGDHPLGPFTYQQHNPFSLKPGGFITGAGHGGTAQDFYGNWWHVATMLNWIKDRFERRIGMFPAGFDAEGVLYANTAFGDYPQLLAHGKRDHTRNQFAGWVLLSYRKPVKASTSLPEKPTTCAVDENIRTYWSAATADSGEWLQVDLGRRCDVRALQMNYADEQVTLYGRHPEIYHQYRIRGSLDGKRWSTLVDKSKNRTDVPHDYVEFAGPVRTRFLRLENVHMAAGLFAIAGFRVFGRALVPPPKSVKRFQVVRRKDDRRDARISWEPSHGAYAYNISYGISPGKLYENIFVNGATSYDIRGLDLPTRYYFAIEAVGEGGVSTKTKIVNVE